MQQETETIQYIPHQEIDRQKWDAAIRQSRLDAPYALTWYLDLVSPDWDALVKGDYEAVMPICRKRKFGIDYLFQPFLAQQLGVFSSSVVQSRLVDDFLSAIPVRYRWIDMHLNETNHSVHEGFIHIERKNFTLELTEGYAALQQGFSRNCKRNINKAEKAGLAVRDDRPCEWALSFLSKSLGNQVKDLKNQFFKTLEAVVRLSIRNGQGMLYSVQDVDKENIIATGWFLKNESRLCFQACASSPEGKEHEAMYLIVDHAIKEYAGSGRILDFTGSNLPGVAYFNASFGARPAAYPAVFRNNLPFPLKTLKKKPAGVNPSGSL